MGALSFELMRVTRCMTTFNLAQPFWPRTFNLFWCWAAENATGEWDANLEPDVVGIATAFPVQTTKSEKVTTVVRRSIETFDWRVFFLLDKHKRRIVKCFLWFYIRVLGSCTRRRRDRSPTPPYEPIHLGVNKKIKIFRFFYVFPFRSSSSRFLYPAVRAPLYNLSSVEPSLCPEPSGPSLLLPL